MIAALVYTLCLLYAPPTPPVYQGFVMPHVSEATGRIEFARAGSIDRIEGAEAYVLIGVSDKDKKTFLDSHGKLLQLVARETSCHGRKILRVSWWKFAPTRDKK